MIFLHKKRKEVFYLTCVSVVASILLFVSSCINRHKILFNFYDNELELMFTYSGGNKSQTFEFKNCSQPTSVQNSNKPRVLCTVFTHKKNFATNAVAVNRTWGPTCDTLLFVTSNKYALYKNKPDLNYAFLPDYSEDYFKLTIKTIKTILYIYANYRNAYDWWLKADDDTFVKMENLKAFLKDKCVYEPHTYGFILGGGQTGMLSGGAGYVLNSQTVNAFVHKYYTESCFCKHELIGEEDVDIARCLGMMGVHPGDSRDQNGVQRFHSNSFDTLIKESKAISRHSISFHRIQPEEMYRLMTSKEFSVSHDSLDST